MIFLDTETRGRVNLTTHGAYRYWRDPETEVILIGWCDELNPPHLVEVNDLLNLHNELLLRLDAGEGVVVHNMQFEQLAFFWGLYRRGCWPRTINFVYDTAAMARAMALPADLDTLSRCMQMNLGLEASGKDTTGRQIMLRFCKPARDGAFFWNDEQYERLGEYCAQDVALTRQVFHALRPLPEDEVEMMHLNERINHRGVRLDIPLAKQLASMLADELADIHDKVCELTGGAVSKATQVARLKAWLEEKTGEHFVTLNAAFIDYAIEEQRYDEDVLEVLALRQRGAKTSVAKIQKMIDAADPDDHRLRGMFVFCGAGKTGRWSSRLVQLHNLPRAGLGDATEEVIKAIHAQGAQAIRLLFGNVMDALPKLIRNLLIAAEGQHFICGDFAGVEARILAWAAGAQDKLDAFRSGQDIYLSVAEQMGFAGERQIGKTCELALGYHGGVGALESMAAKFNVDLSDRDTDDIVKRWRDANPDIVVFWRAVWHAAVEAMSYPNRTIRVQSVVPIAYLYDAVHLWCQLPSGRLICNPFAEAVIVDTPYGAEQGINAVSPSLRPTREDKTWPKLRLWPGILVENICQGIGADLLRWSIRRLEEQNYAVVLHTHDEFTVEVDLDVGIQEIAQALGPLPAWAQGLPFDISWWSGKRYRK